VAGDDRALAIRALGAARARAARDVLLQLTSGGRTLLGRERLASKSPELLASLAALAAGWASDPAVQAVLERATTSKDAEIRLAATAAVPPR